MTAIAERPQAGAAPEVKAVQAYTAMVVHDEPEGTPAYSRAPAPGETSFAAAPTDPDWREQATCRQEPDLWYVGDGRWRTPERDRAILLCETRCPVRDACLADAMTYEAGKPSKERHGIWGGLTPVKRAQLAGVSPPQGRPFLPHCPRPGRQRGLERHARLGQAACTLCREYEDRLEARGDDLDARVLRMRAAGMSIGAIETVLGTHSVRAILARQTDLENTA